MLTALSQRLSPNSETHSLDAQVLAASAVGRSRSWVLAHPEAQITPAQINWLEQAAQRLEAGEALPYVLGKWEFYSLLFTITPDVLIPRPETELLVEQALEWRRRRNPGPLRIADIGTGSGCIAISLACQLPGNQVVASDLSEAALRVAQQNVYQHGVAAQVALVQADLLAPFQHGCFDLVCANLPYIPTNMLRQMEVYSREPTLALDGGSDGLELIRRLLSQAEACMAPGGLLLAEIEATQGPAALGYAQSILPATHITLHQDLAGKDRLLSVEWR